MTSTTSSARELPTSIFPKMPTGDQVDYVTSALMDIRRALTRESSIPRPIEVKAEPHLPEFLSDNRYSLPPWESRLLGHLFTTIEPVLMIRGGAGCGKTSTARFLQSFCQNVLRPSPPRKNEYNFKEVMIRLDLDDLPRHLKKDLENVNHKAREEELGFELVRLFDDAIGTVSESHRGLLFLNTFLNEDIRTSQSAGMSATRTEIRDLYRRAAKVETDVAVEHVKLKVAERVLGDVTTAHRAIASRLLMFIEIARSMRDRDGLPLTIVVDNIDQCPEYLQWAMLEEFLAFAKTTAWEGLRVALFVRLSSYAQSAGALDGVKKIINFEAPNPADLVFLRATAFLLNPESHEDFRAESELRQGMIIDRVLALWRHLSDRGSDFAKILSGLAGTNIRNAYEVSQAWCMSPRLGKMTSVGFSEYQMLLRRAVGVTLLTALCDALGRTLGAALEPENIRLEYKNLQTQPPIQRPEDAVGKRVAQELSETFVALLIDHRIFDDLLDKPRVPDRLRNAFSTAGIRSMVEVLTRRDEQNDEVSHGLRMGASEAARVLVEKLENGQSVFSAFQSHFPQAFKQEICRRLVLDQGPCPVLVRELHALVSECLRSCTRRPLTRRQLNRLRTASKPELLRRIDNLLASRMGSRTSRYKASSILVTPDVDDYYSTEKAAVNLFCSSSGHIAPIGLETLTLLEHRNGGTTVRDLRKHLEAQGLDEDETKHTLGEMVRVNRRVIFSGVKDYETGVDHWWEEPNRLVHVSAAGIAYLSDVVPSPAYLQWAMFGASEIRDKLKERRIAMPLLDAGSPRARIAAALAAFKIYLEEESSRTEQSGGRPGLNNTPVAVAVESPFARVFFDSLHHFLGSLVSDWAYPKHARRDRREIEIQFREWVDFGAALLEKHYRQFNTWNVLWHVEWLEALKEYEDEFGLEYNGNMPPNIEFQSWNDYM